MVYNKKTIRKRARTKITLRNHVCQQRPPLKIDAKLIRNTREKLGFSRAVFALHLRISARTLEKWELGETKPNSQAAALIWLVRKYPDTLDRLAKI